MVDPSRLESRYESSSKWPHHRLRRKKPLLVVCARGLRSYEAVRILRHAGWEDVVYLGGGAQLRRPQLAGD